MTPLIVSAVLRPDAQDDLDAQRRRYFPAGRLQVGAHLTLFHALPGHRRPDVAAVLSEVTGRAPLPITVDEPFGMSHGVGYRLRSRALEAVREELATRFRAELTDQDARRWRPHVTVQNKVDPDEAAATLTALRGSHVPYDTVVEALALWHYRDGPWEAAGRFAFEGS